MIIIGTTLIASSDDYFSEWQEPLGPAATITIIVLNCGDKTDLTVKLQKKDRGEADPTTGDVTVATFSDETGPKEAHIDPIDKDLFRLKFTVGGVGVSGAVRFVHVDVPQPTWERA